MPIDNFRGNTFVAFIDISGFKELMKNDNSALEALTIFYQAGYNALQDRHGIEGFFISDCGILFARLGNSHERLIKLLEVIKSINKAMLRHNYMLTTSISYGMFDYQGKLEFDGIEKNQIYGNAYISAYLDNEKGMPRIQPGQCRIIKRTLPSEINLESNDLNMLKSRASEQNYLYYYWNLETPGHIANFEKKYFDSYNRKYSGMLDALKLERHY